MTTVNELITQLQAFEQAGFGEAEVILSNDDEWNSFRTLHAVTPYNAELNLTSEKDLNWDKKEENDNIRDFIACGLWGFDNKKHYLILG